MKNPTQFASNRPLDVICLGRLAVDFYAQQVGSRLEDVTSFAKYLGGSSGNIAFGTARLGLKSAMLARVGNDHMGRFLTETLAREGCDISHVKTDHDRLTALVVLGLKDRDTFPLIFYRENCADMAVDVADFDESFIASSKALLITGTHFSTGKVHATSVQALNFARKNNVRTVLDIDYRPVLWGLTGKADGETRYISNEGVTEHLQKLLPLFDLIVGTEEEFRIAGGQPDLIPMLRAVREHTQATLVVKRGVLGCSIISGPIPDKIEDAPTFGGVRVDVLNVLGAGDAFMSGFLSGWIRGESYENCAASANACGALVVSRHACAPAMPTPAELGYFLTKSSENPELMRRPDLDKTLNRLHKVSIPRVKWNELFVFAFDHRAQFFELTQKTYSTEARISVLKDLLAEAVSGIERESDSDGLGSISSQDGVSRAVFTSSNTSPGGLKGKIGILCDGHYGQDALNVATGRGWWIGRPVELPGSNPLEFEDGRSIGTTLISWPAEHVIKCLVFYHPDDPVEHRLEQEAQVRTLYDAAQVSGHELLLEIIPPKDRPPAPDTVYRALKRFYNLGIQPDWWKLEPMSAGQWESIDDLILERDPYCRGVLILGLSAPIEKLAAGFAAARNSKTCRGFAVGRTIFEQPSLAWLGNKIDDKEFIRQIQANFRALINVWREARTGNKEVLAPVFQESTNGNVLVPS